MCGLYVLFGGYVYSVAIVSNTNPALDVFLYAAARHGVSPGRCLIIEDSEVGFRAGIAAGMTVWHFAGGARIKSGHVLPQGLHVDRVVKDMAVLGRLFRDAGISGNESVAIPSS